MRGHQQGYDSIIAHRNARGSINAYSNVSLGSDSVESQSLSADRTAEVEQSEADSAKIGKQDHLPAQPHAPYALYTQMAMLVCTHQKFDSIFKN